MLDLAFLRWYLLSTVLFHYATTYQADGLEAIDKQHLIQALINKGMTKVELQELLE